MADYVPSPRQWVADQVALYESSGGTEGITLRDTGLPVIIVTNRGRKTGAVRKTPLMRVVDGKNFILIAVDTLRANRMSVYGYGRPTTPRLEA